MFVTDMAGNVVSANLDGSNRRPILAAQGNLTGIAYAEVSVAMTRRESERKHRVVIIGCGFAGLFAARALQRAPVEVVVVDRTNHHLFQPLLYQVATGVLSEGDIAPPIRDLLRRHRNTRVILGEVTGDRRQRPAR